MARSKVALLVSIILVVCSGCPVDDVVNPWAGREWDALVPIYSEQRADYSNIEVNSPREFNDLGDILTVNDRILLVDFFTGVHILDNSDPSDPINIAFLTLPGVHTISFSGSNLIANYGTELIFVDLSDLNEIEVISSIEGFFNEDGRDNYPRNYEGPFQFVDPDQGILNGWELQSVFHPRCWI